MSHDKVSMACAIALAMLAAPAIAESNRQVSTQACIAKTRGPYGFHCWGSADFGAGFEGVTFVGTVSGDGKGNFEGHGTATSSAGSASTRFAGPATFGPHCAGHVDYTTYELLLPNGTRAPIPSTPSFDFAVVNGGREILGAGVAPMGTKGNAVPRVACRLVRIRG